MGRIEKYNSYLKDELDKLEEIKMMKWNGQNKKNVR